MVKWIRCQDGTLLDLETGNEIGPGESESGTPAVVFRSGGRERVMLTAVSVEGVGWHMDRLTGQLLGFSEAGRAWDFTGKLAHS